MIDGHLNAKIMQNLKKNYQKILKMNIFQIDTAIEIFIRVEGGKLRDSSSVV